MTPYQLYLRPVGLPFRPRTYGTPWEMANPQIAEVYHVTNQARRLGWLRPQPCERCGKKAEAHHDDYSKPLAVRWLCRTHHRQHHAARKRRVA